jgi:ketosteroid isomerase-like protein
MSFATRLLLTVSLASSSAACRSSDDAISEDEGARIERSVRSAVDAFAAAQRERDADAIVGHLAPDFYMYADGTRVDYETVVGQIRSTMPSLQRLETTWSDVEVTVLARDAALVSFVFQDDVTDADGVRARVRGPTSFVWRLREGEWRLVYADADHYPVEE